MTRSLRALLDYHDPCVRQYVRGLPLKGTVCLLRTSFEPILVVEFRGDIGFEDGGNFSKCYVWYYCLEVWNLASKFVRARDGESCSWK